MSTKTKEVGALQTKVAKYKLIAREALRMELINPRLARIANIEGQIAATKKCQDELSHSILVINYELGKLDTEHPDFEETKKAMADDVVELTEGVKEHDKAIEDLNKLIDEQNEGIAKIESGETKVCLESLNELVNSMITKDALNQVA